MSCFDLVCLWRMFGKVGVLLFLVDLWINDFNFILIWIICLYFQLGFSEIDDMGVLILEVISGQLYPEFQNHCYYVFIFDINFRATLPRVSKSKSFCFHSQSISRQLCTKLVPRHQLLTQCVFYCILFFFLLLSHYDGTKHLFYHADMNHAYSPLNNKFLLSCCPI